MQRTWRRAWHRGKLSAMLQKEAEARRYTMTARIAKKLIPAAAAVSIFFIAITNVYATTDGGNIVSGTGTITGQGTANVIVNQASNKLITNWNNFSIGVGEKVQFIQPSASSVALNRVVGNNPSAIYGQLSANGKVFLINPNGVLFAKGAQVDVGGLVASTLNINNKDFENNKYTFSGGSKQAVINQGNISAANGYVALLGAQAVNEGVIAAKQGSAALVAGSKVTLDFTGDGLLNLAIDQGAVNALSTNSGLIHADGGLVIMTAKSADALAGTVVNNSGTIEARAVTNRNGVIILEGADKGVVINSGILDVSGKENGQTGGTVKMLGENITLETGTNIDASGYAGGGTILVGGNYQGQGSDRRATNTTVETGSKLNANAITAGNGGKVVVWADDTTNFSGSISAKGGAKSGNGGTVETSGKKSIKVADAARVNTTANNGKTGNWLLDPADFTIAMSGGDMSGSALSTALQSSDVTIATTSAGSAITGIGGITSGANNSGTNGDINVNDTVNWPSHKLTLSAYNDININKELQGSGTAQLNLKYGQKAPAANNTSTYKINAAINLPKGQNFSTQLGTNGPVNLYTVITDLGSQGSTTHTDLQGIDSSGYYALGADIDASSTALWDSGKGFTPIGNSSVAFSGTFDGLGHKISNLTINRPNQNYIGLFGNVSNSTIQNITLDSCSITGQFDVGGLAGFMSGGTISNAYNLTGTINGYDCVGGFWGGSSGDITLYHSKNLSNVIASSQAGGLIGLAGGTGSKVSIIDSSNEGTVKSSAETAGGLVGSANGDTNANMTIIGSSNLGNVTAAFWAGGLLGFSGNGLTLLDISGSHNEGNVTTSAQNDAGGLVGYAGGALKIDDSGNTGDITAATSEAGGLVGYANNTATITNSHNIGKVTTHAHDAGGLVGYSTGALTIRNSYNTGNITAETSLAGGLVGQAISNTNAKLIISDSYNTGDVTVNTWGAGGLVAYARSGFELVDIRDSYNEGNITATESTAGGLVAEADSALAISNSHNGILAATGTPVADKGKVTSITSHSAGGLVGYSGKALTIATSYNAGDISAIYSQAGGLVARAYNGATINKSYNKGKVTSGGWAVGGLVGVADQSLTIKEQSYNAGKISGDNVFVGGLVGRAMDGLTISDSYNTNSITGYYYVGGLAGYSDGTAQIRSSNNKGNVASTNTNTSLSNVKSFTGGLIGYVYDDLTISNSYNSGTISSYGGVGGLVGYTYDPTEINDSYNEGKIKATSSVGLAGGLVGFSADRLTISNSHNKNEVTSVGKCVGGLVGYASYPLTITGSDNTAAITGAINGIIDSSNWYVGGLVGYANKDITISSSHNTGAITGYYSVGGLVGYEYNSNGTSTVTIKDSYNTGKIQSTDDYAAGLIALSLGETFINNSYNTGEISSLNGGGTGGLAGAIDNNLNITNSNNTGNVTSGGTATDDVGIGGLVGSVTQTLSISKSYNKANISGYADVGGLIGYTPGITNISQSYNEGEIYAAFNCAGGLVGNSGEHPLEVYSGSLTISDSHNSGAVSSAAVTGDFVGGLVGRAYNSLSIENSNNSGAITGNYAVGGLAGFSKGNTDIQGSHNTGTITGYDQETGGLIGTSKKVDDSSVGTIIDSWNTGNITALLYAGGLCGVFDYSADSNSLINNSYSTTATINGSIHGNIIGGSFVGGLAGDVTGASILHSYATGNVTGTGLSTVAADCVGGLIGAGTSVQIDDSYSTGSVTSNRGTNSYAGGLVGYLQNNSSVRNSYSKSTVSGSGDCVGGLIGGAYNGVIIDKSHALGKVTGTGKVGGLVGTVYNDDSSSVASSVTNSFSTGAVTASSDMVGGLIGHVHNNIQVEQSFSTSEVFGKRHTGGLIGNLDNSNVTNSYSTGLVNGTDMSGGLIGYADNAIIKDSYWDKETSGKNIGVGNISASTAPGKTTAELMAALQTNWSPSVWGIIKGKSYPYLKWRYQGTPQVVSGKLTDANGLGIAQQTVQSTQNGSLLGNTTTGANGFYYMLFDKNTISDNTAVLAYVANNNSLKGNAITRTTGTNASVTNLELIESAVNVHGGSSTEDLDVNDLLVKAKSNLTDNILYTVSVGGNINVTGTNQLTVSAPNSALVVNHSLDAGGDILLKAKNDLTLNATGSVASTGGNVTLVSTDGSFKNNNTAVNALRTGTGKRWLVYSANPALATRGNLDYDFSQYNKAYGDTTAISRGDNGFIYSSPLDLSVTFTGTVDKTYDGNRDVNLQPANLLLAVIGLDNATASYTGNPIDASYNLPHVLEANTVTVNNTAAKQIASDSAIKDANGKDVYGYTTTLMNTTVEGSIRRAPLTVTANDFVKDYDSIPYSGGNGITYTGLVQGETPNVITGIVRYSGPSQGATEGGKYPIIPDGLTAPDYAIEYKAGTLIISPTTDPRYKAAVQQPTQEVTNSVQPPASNNETTNKEPKTTGSQPSNVQYRPDTNEPARIVTTSAKTVTIVQDSLVQLQTNGVQKDIPVYQNSAGNITQAATYHVDSIQGTLSLSETSQSLPPASAAPAPQGLAQNPIDGTSFQLIDAQGQKAIFKLTYNDNALRIEGDNDAAKSLMHEQNLQKIITASGLVAAQEKLAIDVKEIHAVCLNI